MPSLPPSYRPPPPDAPEGDVAPLLLRIGAIVGAGVLAAITCVVPAALRISGAAGVGFASGWLALVACAIVPCIVGVLVARGAREGLRAFAGPHAALHGAGVATWLACTFTLAAAFGALLRARTHHHGLAGVTFALGALAIAVAVALVVRRLVALATRAPAGLQSALVTASVLLAGVAFGAAVLGMMRAPSVSSPGPTDTASLLVDGLAFVIAVAFFARNVVVQSALLARSGLPLAVGLLVLGSALLARAPALGPAIEDHAPAFVVTERVVLRR